MRNCRPLGPELDGVWCYNDSLASQAVNIKENNRGSDWAVGGMDSADLPSPHGKWRALVFTGGHYYAYFARHAHDVLNGIDYEGEVKVLGPAERQRRKPGRVKAKYQGDRAIDANCRTNPNASYIFVLLLTNHDSSDKLITIVATQPVDQGRYCIP